ncbi:MAG: replicative helicase [Burkholderiales bacterium]|jgi:replicative DNA helicase|nr:replicative helicase [Burkholderiales bacterium]MCE3268120.1 replicative helicase [Burkholderiales bacterium]
MAEMTTEEVLKTPPHSVEAEQMILGCILVDEDSYINIAGVLQEAHFYRKEHQMIFHHIVKLKSYNRNVDALTVADSLKQNNEIEYVGGYDYINSLVEATASSANIKSYADIVRERYVLRDLVKAGSEIAQSAYTPNGRDIDIILDEAEQKIFKIKDVNTNNKRFFNLQELLNSVIERVVIMSQREDKNAVTGIATHYTQLDDMTSGLQRGELIIIAGRPGMGKTSFALNIGENVALKNKLPVAVFSLEMTGEQLVQRLLSSAARVDQTSLKRGDLTYDDMDKLYLAMGDLKHAPLYINESPGINVIDLRARVRRLKDQLGDLGLIVIDYVQIMSGLGGGKNTNRAQEIADISRSLKALALELSVPIILLSQLNREVESRQDKRPNIADLRESGALEQDADIILLLYRDSYYDQESKEGNLAEINIAKNRSGSTGVVKLAFLNKFTRFENPYLNYDEE